MPEATERDILIEVRTKVEALHGELLGAPGREGRMPKLEATVSAHSEQINKFSGAFWTAVWIAGGILTLLSGALALHIQGGH